MTPSAHNVLTYASTALAAYAQWTPNTSDDTYKGRLRGEGMALEQADAFVKEFRVLAYFNDSTGSANVGTNGLGQGTRIPTSASATVFERISNGERILAIRGTVPTDPGDLWADFRDIFLYRSVDQQSQYAVLSKKVAGWIADKTLPAEFTVTGHSLGGFLALELSVDLPSKVSHAYLFNAPGLGGFQVSGHSITFNQWLATVYPTRPALNDSKITNVTAQGGSSLIATLGVPVGDRINIAIETERLPSLNPLELVASHKIETVTDALAVYDLLSRVDPALSMVATTKIVEAASSNSRETLERVVKTLALVLGTSAPAVVETRDQLFEKIVQLKNNLSSPENTYSYHVVPLSDKTAAQITGLAQSDIAVRYALRKLDPFAISGNAALFAGQNTNGELDLASDNGYSGALTPAWLADRAELLLAQSFVNTFEDGDTIRRQFGSSKDLVVIQPGLDPHVIRVVGPEGAAPPVRTVQIIFGSDQADTLTGLDAADHLYGDIGDDRISGGKGDDYLEGGPGRDDLKGGLGNDQLVGGAGDDTLDGGAGSDRLEGGPGLDTYIVHAGPGTHAVITDSDGHGKILLEDTAITGGVEIRPGEYRSGDGSVIYRFGGSLDTRGTLVVGSELEVQNFLNGDLGITLSPRGDPTVPDAGGARTYLDSPYDQASLKARLPGDPSPHFPWGSPYDDTYVAGPLTGAKFLGRGGDDHLIGGGIYPALLVGGAGDDWIENREIIYADDFVTINPHLLAGEAGRDVLSGSTNDEYLFGDFYRIHVNPDGVVNASTSGFRAHIDQLYLEYAPVGAAGSPSEIIWGTYEAPEYAADAYNDLAKVGIGTILTAIETFLGFSAATRPDDAYDDIVDGGGGDDVIVGGPGNDELYGGDGNDRLFGDDPPRGAFPFFDKNITAPEFNTYLDLFGQPGDDVIDGGDGDDEIYDVAIHSSVAIGGAGDDTITILITSDPALAADAVIVAEGGDGDDVISVNGWAGEISVDAGPGDDQITASGAQLFVDGGPGSDTYDVRGLDITIRDDGADPGDTDTLTFNSSLDEFHFSRDGDDLVVRSWIDLSDDDQVGPDGEAWSEATLRVEDWFADARFQIEEIVLAPIDADPTRWTPQDIQAALDDGGPAWSDFIEPESPTPEPIALAAPPPPAPQTVPQNPPPTVPVPAEEEPSVPVNVPPAPVHLTVADTSFNGRIDGTAGADTFLVFSTQGVVIDAGAGDDRITTGSGPDRITLGAGNDVAITGGGDDRIVIDRFEGAKTIDGGPGIDTLTIGASLSSLRISITAGGGEIIFRDAGGDRLNTTNVNVFEFPDAVVYREGGESEADVARLYETMLSRPTDPARPKLWLDQIMAAGGTGVTAGAFAGEPDPPGACARAQDEAPITLTGPVLIPEPL